MANNTIFGLDPKNKVVETEKLLIRGHLLRWSDTVIQISNISMVSTAPLPTMPFPWLAILFILIGLFLSGSELQKYYPDDMMVLLGVAFLVGGVLSIALWHYLRKKNEGKMYLNLALNSGTVYSFLFSNKNFMYQVLQVFANIFESPIDSSVLLSIAEREKEPQVLIQNLSIDLKGNTITDTNGNLLTLALR